MRWRDAVLVALGLLLGSRPAGACSVGGFPRMQPNEAEIAFSGTVESVQVPFLLRACGGWPRPLLYILSPFIGPIVVQLRVDDVWRGFEGERARVSFAAGCGATAPGLIGQKWLFLEHADPDTLAGEFEAGPCYFPGLLSAHAALARSLGTPHAPRGLARRRDSTGVYVASGLGAAGLWLLFAWGRRKRARTNSSG